MWPSMRGESRGALYKDCRRVMMPGGIAIWRRTRHIVGWGTLLNAFLNKTKGTAQKPISGTPHGMLGYCTWVQDAASTKAQEEMWLVSGLKDHRHLSVRTRHKDTGGPATNKEQSAIGCKSTPPQAIFGSPKGRLHK